MTFFSLVYTPKVYFGTHVVFTLLSNDDDAHTHTTMHLYTTLHTHTTHIKAHIGTVVKHDVSLFVPSGIQRLG